MESLGRSRRQVGALPEMSMPNRYWIPASALLVAVSATGHVAAGSASNASSSARFSAPSSPLASQALWSHTTDDLKRAAQKPPREPEQALALGLTLRRAGLFSESYNVLRSTYLRVRQATVGSELRLEAARSLHAQGEYKRAIAECGALKALSEVRHRVCLAESQLLWKRASLALEQAEKAVAASADDYDARVALGRALQMSGKPSDAETALNAAIQRDASRWQAHFALGKLYAHENRARAKRVAAFRAAYKADPEVPEVLVELAAVLDPGTEAREMLELALKIRPSYSEALAGLGSVQLALQKPDEALKHLTAALKLDSKRADWWVALGRAQLAKTDPKAALKSAEAAQKLVKNDSGAKLLEADALAAAGDIDVAIEAYELAYGYANGDPAPLVHAAQACLTHDRPTTGRAFAERATQEYPKWGPAWVIAGDLAVVQSDKGPARTAYKRALKAQGPVDKAAVRRKLAALK